MAAPTSQQSGVKPISFVLQRGLTFDAPVTLKIRPTDLTRNETSRSTVRQTLGREVVGWLDSFGEGIPAVTISGHTGWRAVGASGDDGVDAFKRLNQLIQHDYHAAKQAVIDKGGDPDTIKLLFIDTLDDFTWSVTPLTFALQRSKSQPLLMRYNMQLQALDTEVDNPFKIVPIVPSRPAGLSALDSAISTLEGWADSIQKLSSDALAYVDNLLTPIASTVKKFLDSANRVFRAVQSMVASVKNLVSGVINKVIGIAKDIAQVGVGLAQTFAAIASLPSFLKAQFGRIGSAFREIKCIFSNALKPKKSYSSYESLYGASNCSSSMGGSASSALAGTNAFAQIQPTPSPITMSSSAQSSVSTVNRGDPVLAPISMAEMGRHVDIINNGVAITGSTA